MVDPTDPNPGDRRRGDADAETLLEALACGECDPAEPSVQARFREDPELLARFLRRQELALMLDEHGADDRRRLAAALRTPSPFDAMARDTALHPARGPARWRRSLPLLAALLVVAFSALLLLRRDTATEDSTLGTGGGEMWPQGEVADYESFGWRLQLPAGCRYRLRFRENGPDGRELFEVELLVTEWKPNATYRSRMTARMAWELEVVDSSDRVVDGRGPVMLALR